MKKNINTKFLAYLFTALTFLFSFHFAPNQVKAAETAEFYFEPSSLNLEGEGSVKLMLDPKGQEVDFVRASVYFDPAVVKLTSDISVNESVLVSDPETTNTDAGTNNNGSIVIVLRQDFEDLIPGPSNPFEIATFSFEPVDPETGANTDLTIVDEDSEIIGAVGEISFETRYADVSIAGGETGGRGGRSMEGVANARGGCEEGSIDTAIGCIPVSDTGAMASFLLTWGIGIAGGIAFVLMVYSGYMIITGQGDPKRVQAGKELMTAAVMGLSFLILSVFLLRFIGVDILGIPGL